MPSSISQYLNVSYDDFRKEVWLVREYIEGLDLETLMKVKCTVTCYDLQNNLQIDVSFRTPLCARRYAVQKNGWPWLWGLREG